MHVVHSLQKSFINSTVPVRVNWIGTGANNYANSSNIFHQLTCKLCWVKRQWQEHRQSKCTVMSYWTSVNGAGVHLWWRHWITCIVHTNSIPSLLALSQDGDALIAQRVLSGLLEWEGLFAFSWISTTWWPPAWQFPCPCLHANLSAPDKFLLDCRLLLKSWCTVNLTT